MNKMEASKFGPASWNSHHPVAAPYFLEFLDLISEVGGVDFYQPEMAIENFIPSEGVDGDLSKSEVDYISSLINNAHKAGQRPALCDTRSLGRSRAIHKKFGGTHVLLTRNLHEQWCSFSEQAADDNNFFFDTFFRQIKAGNQDPFLRFLGGIAEKKTEQFETDQFYAIFLLAQLYLNAIAFDVCQVKLNVTEITSCANTRQETEKKLSQFLYSEIDLKDAQTHVSFNSLETKSRKSAEKLARQLLSEMTIPNASIDCKNYVQKSFDDAFRCWDHSIYYGEATKHFISKKIEIERKRATSEAVRALSLENKLRELHIAASEVHKSTEAALEDAAKAYAALSQHVEYLNEKLATEMSAKESALNQLEAEQKRSILSTIIKKTCDRFEK